MQVDIGDLFLHNLGMRHLHNIRTRLQEHNASFNNTFNALFSHHQGTDDTSQHAITLPQLSTDLEGIPFHQLFASVLTSIPSDPRTYLGQRAHSNPYGFIGSLYSFDIEDEMDYDDYEANLELADRIGKVEIGVEDINEVSSLIDPQELEHKCPVCMEEFSTMSSGARKLLCKHAFCQPCIETWLSKNKKCPICSVDLEDLRLKTSK